MRFVTTTPGMTPAEIDAVAKSDLRIELVDQPRDIEQAFEVLCATFGYQTKDGIFMAMNPGWAAPEGKTKGTARMVERWQKAARNKDGDLNTTFLKATVPHPDQEGERLAIGIAIWVQASVVDGYGEAPVEDLRKVMDLEALCPGNPSEQRFICQIEHELHKKRIQLVKEKATASPPAVMVLDLCVVDPAWQGRGIAKKLVQWGLNEAERRGGLEAITEASVMGRRVYEKMGFKGVEEIEYEVDAEFADRSKPSNLFMRTAGP
ncbi:hypothetical protein B0I35DRAFT_435810 [Stachybotrys elegans]|uniref:N-acetyltransferase domain-containing protein n=1 Tax=Stachybotrys elegans TaxID=80388 RepID=A0A8K0SPX4_9HYPO|nr:hypothetical protein B0I35DRAFT_435810 [Stachybotrys elegans]